MKIQKLDGKIKSLIIALSLLSGLTFSACSAEPMQSTVTMEQIDTSQLYQLGIDYYRGNS